MKKFHKAILFLIAGYVFLYLPLIIVSVYSFNKSPILSVWQGFSWKWYEQLLSNDALFSSIMASLKIASISATLAVIFTLFPYTTLFRSRKSVV